MDQPKKKPYTMDDATNTIRLEITLTMEQFVNLGLSINARRQIIHEGIDEATPGGNLAKYWATELQQIDDLDQAIFPDH